MFRRFQRQTTTSDRKGAVAVEFAFVAPVLVAIVVGMVKLTAAFDAQTLLESAAREGARFAAMDRDGLLADGQTTNEKLISDVKTFLDTNGIDADDVSVSVTDYENPGAPFDLDDPDNALKLFEVSVSVDYSSVSTMSVGVDQDYTMVGAVVFRNGIATIAE